MTVLGVAVLFPSEKMWVGAEEMAGLVFVLDVVAGQERTGRWDNHVRVEGGGAWQRNWGY